MKEMRSDQYIVSIKEVHKVLLEIDNCRVTIPDCKFEDGTIGEAQCSIEILCPSCADKFYGLLEWAEDMEEDNTTQVTA